MGLRINPYSVLDPWPFKPEVTPDFDLNRKFIQVSLGAITYTTKNVTTCKMYQTKIMV